VFQRYHSHASWHLLKSERSNQISSANRISDEERQIMARLRWIGGESDRGGAGRHLAGEANLGHPSVVRLATEEVERIIRDDAATDWDAATERFKRACRTFGVVLAAAAAGLDRLDSCLYRPLRDASLLTAKLLEGEVAERASRGVPLRAAFGEVIDSWLEDFGMLLVSQKPGPRPDAGFPSLVSTVVTRAAGYQAYPPYSYPPHMVLLQRVEETAAAGLARLAADPAAADERARRMQRRRAAFQACDADFQGPGGNEVGRVIFVTALLIRDAVHSRAKRVPPPTFAVSYRQVVDRYNAATAKLVLDAEHPVAPRGRRRAT